MSKAIELGVFMPAFNNGWIISENAPQYMPTFDLNKRVGQLAEEIGFDFLFSAVKWRGFDGATEHWNHTLEPVTMMTGVAAVTERIGIIASMVPLTLHPAVAAKMAATIDDISGGRFGINIVTGTYFGEYGQMGLYPEGYDRYRYEQAQEWIDVLNKLWTEDRTTHQGNHYELEDCQSSPKPIQQPRPLLVCAGMSERGMAFTAKNADMNFVSGESVEELVSISRRSKEVAAEMGAHTKTATVIITIIADTDEEAQAMVDSYRAGSDTEAWKNIGQIYAADPTGKGAQLLVEQADKDVFYFFRPIWGSAETVARQLTEIVEKADMDALLFTFPDYIDGLRRFAAGVRPEMERLGIRFSTSAAEPALV
jgi:pyrimidine oxygenase